MQKACRQALVLALTIALLCTAFSWKPGSAEAAGDLELYTPYRQLTAAPGESITYSIDLINLSGTTQLANLSFRTNHQNWSYDLTTGGKNVQEIAVKAHDSQSLSLRLDVPLQIDPGNYTFTVSAGDASLPLTVTVAEKGTFNSNFELEQSNMEGYAGSDFTFSATLRNQTAEEQTYALSASPANGWEVRFMSSSNYVSSVTIDPNASQTISVKVTAPEGVEAGDYSIPIAAYNNATQAEASIEVSIIGSYNLSIKTSDERLNTTIRAGGSRTLEFIVENTGTAALEDINVSSITPTNWEVQFEPKTIASLEPGKTASVQAIITSNEDSLPGDYAMSVTARSDQKSADASLRVTVKSSVLWGWIGVAIIAAVIIAIYSLFRRYGRR
ncbi:NEW3 domain-containing protein [Paenibacillus septentrionalis]|uniref:NEW3 domain-containing protein n=1 Tax=Paenibacillus septentrionalis TaxID=429342 RepID=A0ABW1UYT1_9BACL